MTATTATTADDGAHDIGWTADDRAAARAFLQRCEVRLSTLHRVATALLSGAGLMVLLPAMLKDQLTEVVRTLFTARHTVDHVLLAVAAAVVLILPFIVLFLLLGDLTRFYFHGQHLPAAGGHAFAPRFTLTGLQLPADELSGAARQRLDLARRDPATVELLVPATAAGRSAIDAKLDAYGGLGRTADSGDLGRAAGLFDLVASRPRTLAEEVAKVEHGMARHLLRLQVIVMRYVKALLAFLTTAIAVYATLAVLHADPSLPVGNDLGLATIFAWWAPAMVFVVGSPVRWVENLLRAEGATAASIAADREFSLLEQVSIVSGIAGFVLATAAAVTAIGRHPGRWPLACTGVAIAAAGASLAIAVRRSHSTKRR